MDLRLTFYLWSAFIFLAFLVARKLREEGAVSTRVLVFNYLPRNAADWFAATRPMVIALAAWRVLVGKPRPADAEKTPPEAAGRSQADGRPQ